MAAVAGGEVVLGTAALVERLLPLVSPPAPVARPWLVAVDGPSGAGKTVLAGALAAALTAPLLHVEDLYPGWDGLAVSVPLLADGVLTPLAAGRPGRYRRWDWTADAPGAVVEVPPAPLLVVEGVGCGARAAARWVSRLVWVQAPAGVRRERALARDGDVYAPHWERWAAQETRLFAAEGTRERADVVVDSALPGGADGPGWRVLRPAAG
ncbi:nucleoside/nucleotide kinase family protein [Kineococcus sp. SYSU DK004]|uniref:hypothetical protein n=1 Tax=Kineococcus sp. SYSU DK004 TaxID=3383125 RepID=UPI003D7D9A16